MSYWFLFFPLENIHFIFSLFISPYRDFPQILDKLIITHSSITVFTFRWRLNRQKYYDFRLTNVTNIFISKIRCWSPIDHFVEHPSARDDQPCTRSVKGIYTFGSRHLTRPCCSRRLFILCILSPVHCQRYIILLVICNLTYATAILPIHPSCGVKSGIHQHCTPTTKNENGLWLCGSVSLGPYEFSGYKYVCISYAKQIPIQLLIIFCGT